MSPDLSSWPTGEDPSWAWEGMVGIASRKLFDGAGAAGGEGDHGADPKNIDIYKVAGWALVDEGHRPSLPRAARSPWGLELSRHKRVERARRSGVISPERSSRPEPPLQRFLSMLADARAPWPLSGRSLIGRVVQKQPSAWPV